MVNSSGMNLLFFLGVLIPALVTVALFVVFCYCWYKMRIRNQILYKKHDPHGIEKLKDGEIYEPPPPPLPPFKSHLTRFNESMNHHNNNNVKGKSSNDNYEDSPEPTEGFDNQLMYRAKPDSGFSDLNQIQCNLVDGQEAPKQNSDRPHSQASDDSDDSGFRSSRSGQYIHSASNSSGNGQDTCQNVHSCHDTAPLFKPIKIHPNENGLLQSVSYKHRNSGKHRPLRHRSMLHPSHHNSPDLESHSMNNIHTISHLQPSLQFGTPQHVCNSTTSHLCHMQQISKSNYDVHGGKLHSIDSHLRPLTSVGYYGPVTSTFNQGHVPFLTQNGHYGGNIGSQPLSIGYSSDMNSIGQMQNMGHTGFMVNPNLKRDLSYHIPNTSISMSQKTPITTHIPPFSESHINSNHSVPMEPKLLARTEPMPLGQDSPVQLTMTTAMVHRPYIEELADPSLYSVV